MTWGWHFARSDLRLQYSDGALIEPGYALVVEGPLRLCHWGLHASKLALDALQYAPAKTAATRVRLGGRTIHGDDKSVAHERYCAWALTPQQTGQVLHEFACWCAEQVMHLVPVAQRPTCVAAITAKRGWLRGEVSALDLDAAGAAACYAACYAACAAACAAASAAACAAARDAACYAASDAACAAARDAASAAACAAASAAACAAARDAARSDQNRQLEKMLKAARKCGA